MSKNLMPINKDSILTEVEKARQIAKGTYDSPCLSVCNYNDNGQCQTCGMLQSEKKHWKTNPPEEDKERIRQNAAHRREEMEAPQK